MNNLRGSYTNTSVENIENFYLAINAYRSACLDRYSRPELTIFRKHGVWSICTESHRPTIVDIKFKEEFDDAIEGYKDDFKGIATFEGDTLKIVSTSAMTQVRIIRTYKPTRAGCILTLTHPESGTQAIRIYSRM